MSHAATAISVEPPSEVQKWDDVRPLLNRGVLSLSVVRVGLEGVGADIAALLPNLTALDLSGNALTALPRALTALRSLRVLDVSANAIGKLSKRVARLCDLEVVDLRANKLRTLPLDALMALPRLRRVSVGGNFLCPRTLLSSHDRRIVCNVLCAGVWDQRVPSHIEGEERLFIGGLESTRDLDELRKLGVTHVLSVGVSPAPAVRSAPDIAKLHIAIADWPQEQLAPHLAAAVAFVDEGTRPGHACLVHCLAGQSRSASMVIAWLIVRRGMGFDEAFALLRRTRFCVCPNLGFQEQLKTFQLRFGRPLK